MRTHSERLPVPSGDTLHVERWLPETDAVGLIVIAHGIAEHVSRYAHVAERLVDAGWAVAGPDHRGHGRSTGRQGDLRDLEVAAADLELVADWADVAAPRVLLGHSMGSLVAALAAARRPDAWDGLILSGTALDAGADLPGATVAALTALARVAPRARLAPPLDPELVCTDPAVVAAYRDDPLVDHGRPRLGTALGVLRAAAAIRDVAPVLGLPTLVLHGRSDELTPASGAEWIVAHHGGDDVRLETYDGAHEILNEPNRDRVLDDIVDWLQERFPA